MRSTNAGSATPIKSRKTDRTRDPRDTPAMRQYISFKEAHPDCILFFRMGDFYEMFDEDAKLAHAALGITLTERTSGIPMAGVPYHAAEQYLRRLIEQGFRVAVCEQVQDPRDAKGIVDRAISRIITPGTLVDDSLLDDAVANHIAAVSARNEGGNMLVDIAVVELSTGSFRLIVVPMEQAIDELVRLGPSELLHQEEDEHLQELLAEARAALQCAITPRGGWTFHRDESARVLREHWNVHSLEGFGIEDGDDSHSSAGALLAFLLETQSGHGNQAALPHLQPPRREQHEQVMAIDAATLRSLEIERTMRTGDTEGSLLSILQRCRTPMGRRDLRNWLCYPLQDRTAIIERQDVVESLVNDEMRRERIRDTIDAVQDVARISSRVAMRRATPRDLWALGHSLAVLPELVDLTTGLPALDTLHARFASTCDEAGPLGERIRRECGENPPAHLREGGLFSDGVDAELDESRMLQRDGTAWLSDYQQQLSAETGIPSLKVGYNKVFGYYIEVTNSHVDRVPIAFNRKQTLKNAERYITPELKEYEEKVTSAERRAIDRERILFDQLCSQVDEMTDTLSAFSDAIAEVDVLACFGELAARHGYTRPEITEGRELEIEDGRHPVLDATIGSGFVPNDTRLGLPDSPTTLALITGPNMAGKSTYIRQVALIVLLAHTGCFVPATRARIGCVDRIFTRIGASDELHSGRSTFMVEMTETANILHHASSRSLVILDEIGRGTSTLDGLSLAWAITEMLAETGCRTLFATHYHELTSLADQLDAVGNLHVGVREWEDKILFLYRIQPGSTDRSYGIHVAQLAGVPRSTLQRAGELLESLSVHTGDVATPTARTPSSEQLDLFNSTQPHPALDSLRALDINGMTPLEAFDTLRRLIKQAGES